jgi:hypothetical protein
LLATNGSLDGYSRICKIILPHTILQKKILFNIELNVVINKGLTLIVCSKRPMKEQGNACFTSINIADVNCCGGSSNFHL